jgi:hypothetical protein
MDIKSLSSRRGGKIVIINSRANKYYGKHHVVGTFIGMNPFLQVK